jgi:excisionase family DNA binding protein
MFTENESSGLGAAIEKRVYSRKEAAEYLGVSLATIDRAIATEQISVSYLRARVVIQSKHLEEYLNRNVKVARPKRVARGLLGLER